MSFETATVKPEANFPAAHPYWPACCLVCGHVPGAYRGLGASGSAMGCAPARYDWRGLYRVRRRGRPAEREHHRAGRRSDIRRRRACRLAPQSAIDRRRICGHGFWDSLSSPPWPLRRHAALVYPLLRRVRLDPWSILAGLVVVRLLSCPTRAGPDSSEE